MKRMNKFLLYFLLTICLSSCLSTKKTQYFQGDISNETSMRELEKAPYRLQVNDVLSISIKTENSKLVALFDADSKIGTSNNALYFNGYSVDRHGNIRIPYIGEINVLGYTEKEVREKIELELKNFIKNPESIFVSVKLSGIKFIVAGEVGSPGTINLPQNEVSIVEAITNAGDISIFGDKQNVTIIRKTIDGVQRFSVDMTKIDIFNSKHFYIQPNDVVFVPALRQKNWGTGATGFQTFTTIASILSVVATTVLLVKNL
ncbi:MAG: polysaccharide export outer membrane protein [Flavobacteriales bacterium]|jgi:polysaccharide export outer membrane protein|tara:strand:- start:2957 stop:3736 length:780 start_codon:yes stop_codon:yes gene_type:complete